LETQPIEGTISLLEEGAFMKPSSFDLTGKVVIVSGGATGIGRAIANGLAEAGASIVICGRRFHKCEEACKKSKKALGPEPLLTDAISPVRMKLKPWSILFWMNVNE
jgi:shikimate 5-dehydrogenase